MLVAVALLIALLGKAIAVFPDGNVLLTEITDPNSTSYVGTAGPGRYVSY